MRLGLSLLGGVIAALGLFVLMNSLIASRASRADIDPTVTIVDFVRVPQESPLEIKDRKKPPKPQPARPRPPSPRMTVSKVDKPQAETANVITPDINVPMSVGGGPYLGSIRSGEVVAEGDVIPVLRIAPQYPRAARQRGTEGFVTVKFTINEDGTVSDPEVVQAQPPRVFDRAALRAIRRWQFKPRVVEGVPVKRGAEQTIEFKLAD